MQWMGSLILITLSLTALCFYAIGSYKLYKNKEKYLLWLSLAVIVDAIAALTASFRVFVVLEVGQRSAWDSFLFITHISLAGGAQICFLLLFIYFLYSRSVKKELSDKIRFRLSIISYRILLPMWAIGATIAILNFFWKLIYGNRIYDLL